jgi:flagellar biosynthetic protein FlhB
MPIDRAVESAGRITLDAVLAALGAGIVFALADVAIARWRWERSTRMSDTEAREERRRADGDPEAKSRRMAAARRTAAGLARGKDLRGQAA